ncbi:MAG: 1-acyl-sn-glycerol-3-phosphate acyltransferase [Clostridia bacterium]|nr:1-acyl-sn-glycerol-3-phosphate acyltransferase [Clostridia bacterium]
MSKSEIINIFYACDDNFVKFTAVSLFSMQQNASRDRKYHIHVLHTNINEETQKSVLKMADECFTVTFDDVSSYLDDLCERLPLRDYYSNTTYYRMFIAEMFPRIEKAIYIDSDTVVQGDISRLYDYDIESFDVGACHEQAMVQVDVYGTYVEKCLGLDRNRFFNAGVLLINCRRFRERKILERFVKLLAVFNCRVTQDEDYLNILCYDHVRFLPQTWNSEVFGEMLDKPEDCSIVHYIMVEKPWHFPNCRLKDIFWKYAEQIDCYEDICRVLAEYTDEQRAADEASCDRLYQLAIDETARPDTYVARVAAARDQGRVAVVNKIAEYERAGRFDEDVEDDPPGRQIEPGEVDYLRKKITSKLRCKIAYSMARKFLNGILENKQMIVNDIVGLEHYAALDGGAVVTCNHFNAFDSFAMQIAYENAGQKKKRTLYRVIREGNYTAFPGFFGYLMRNYNTLPLASKPAALKEFIKATDTLLKRGDLVLVYPEQSMWWNYRKPKPLKSGGFYFAAKNRVPVLPCFITMKDSYIIGEDGFPVQEYTIHVAPPIYPDENKSVSANSQMMMEKNAQIWKEIYEREYGIELKYEKA